jgi:hypothetical protein
MGARAVPALLIHDAPLIGCAATAAAAAAAAACAAGVLGVQGHALAAAAASPNNPPPCVQRQVKEEGWAPQHVVVRDASGKLVGACPLYLKGHSYGEYVFDSSWANFYGMNGGR